MKKPKNPDYPFANQHCYAKTLGDCSRESSREHYFSESVLKLIGPRVRLKGTPWLGGQQKLLPLNAIASNILCKRHNEMLSPLDDEAGRFFAAVEMMKAEKLEDPSFRSHILFSGEAIELWLLKVALGVVCAGSAGKDGGERIRWEPGQNELEILFNDRPWTLGRGLHLKAPVGRRQKIVRNLSFMPITHRDTGELIACEFSMWSYSFLLPFGLTPIGDAGGPFEHAEYRPRWLDFNKKKGIIELSWRNQSLQTAIHVLLDRNEKN